jgi:hypothetical protein
MYYKCNSHSKLRYHSILLYTQRLITSNQAYILLTYCREKCFLSLNLLNMNHIDSVINLYFSPSLLMISYLIYIWVAAACSPAPLPPPRPCCPTATGAAPYFNRLYSCSR